MNNRMGLALAMLTCALIWQSPFAHAQDRDPVFSVDRSDVKPEGARRPLTEEELLDVKRRELLQEFDAETSLDSGASIHPKLMLTVKDNTIGIRYEEREAYLRILRLAQEVPLRKQQRFAAEIKAERRETTPSYKRRKKEDFPQFVDLFTHPEFYRGQPVTLQGVMRKLTKFDVGPNSLDLGEAYEGWVYTPDSQGNPAVVVFTSKDERLPVNGDIQEEVRFTGYYFKMYGYDAHDTTRKAPLIIAGEVEWVPHPYKAVYHGISRGWYALTGLAFLVICYIVWQVNRIEMPPRPASQIEPDFTHFPPREHPAPDPFISKTVAETEDS